MTEFLQYKSAIVIATLVALLALERLYPMARMIGGLRRVGRNLGLSGLNAILSWLIVVPLTAAAAGHALDWRPLWWAGWPGLAVDVLILDLWIYWWHRTNHLVPLLWRFHEIHHLDNFLDASSGLRFHFAEVLLSSLVRAAVILAAGMPLASVLVFETLVAVFAMFQHSNLRLPAGFERALSWVIVTPSIHWIHHHALRRDTDSNYAFLLSLWDHVFRSRSAAVRNLEMAIGVEGQADKPLPELVRRPFTG
jgi:sterol desaturase/sphingolipid hydroxylase (fatty acid hydroxylase superfamily)